MLRKRASVSYSSKTTGDIDQGGCDTVWEELKPFMGSPHVTTLYFKIYHFQEIWFEDSWFKET